MTRGFAALVIATIALAVAMFASPWRAEASGLSAASAGQPLSVCIRPAQAGDDPAKLIRDPGAFDCTAKQTSYGAGNFWALSENIDQRSRSRRPLATRIGSVWQDKLNLYVLYADGRIRAMQDDNRGISQRIQLGAVVEHPLPRAAENVVRVMWKVEGAANVRGVVLGARLATEDESERANLGMTLIYASFAGLCIALLVYNLALWAALRHPFQLAYCLMVALLLGYAITSSGALAWMVSDIANNDRLRLNYLLIGLAAASAIYFARTFFEAHVFGPRLRLLVRAAITLLVATSFAFALFAPMSVKAVRVLDMLYSGTFLAVVGVVGVIMWSAWHKRSNFLWLFALAWATPIVAASLRAFASLGLIEWSFWLDNSTILSMAAEALMSSVAIAYRIRLLSQERDQAVAAETVARRLADTDPLTGLLNRRAFLAHAIGRAGDQTLLVLDLDHFKQVNDTIGHDGGDEVLRAVARAMRALAPPGTLVARIGGEEFAMVGNAGQTVDTDALLTRLRATRMPFDLRVTASIGTATGPLTVERDWKTLYRAADRALFDAKAGGRDRAKAARQAA